MIWFGLNVNRHHAFPWSCKLLTWVLDQMQLFSSWYRCQLYGIHMLIFFCDIITITSTLPSVRGPAIWNSYADCLWYHYNYNIFRLMLFSHVIMELAGMRLWEHTLSCLLSQLPHIKICLLAYGLRWSMHPVLSLLKSHSELQVS